jgi:hypothetical protein
MAIVEQEVKNFMDAKSKQVSNEEMARMKQ